MKDAPPPVDIWAVARTIRDPEELFNYICFANYIAGQLGFTIPHLDSWNAYQRLLALERKKVRRTENQSQPNSHSDRTGRHR